MTTPKKIPVFERTRGDAEEGNEVTFQLVQHYLDDLRDFEVVLEKGLGEGPWMTLTLDDAKAMQAWLLSFIEAAEETDDDNT